MPIFVWYLGMFVLAALIGFLLFRATSIGIITAAIIVVAIFLLGGTVVRALTPYLTGGGTAYVCPSGEHVTDASKCPSTSPSPTPPPSAPPFSPPPSSAPPSAPPSNPPSTGGTSAGCPADAPEASRILGASLIQIGTEPCAFVWNSKEVGANHVSLPEGVWGTLTLPDGRIVLTTQPGPYDFTAATFRWSSAYPGRTPCVQLKSEQAFLDSQHIGATIAPVGFSCDGQSSPPQAATQSSSQSAAAPPSSCPADAASAAKAMGIAESVTSATKVGANGWQVKFDSPVSFTVPQGITVDYDGGHATSGQTVPSGVVFTVYCG